MKDEKRSGYGNSSVHRLVLSAIFLAYGMVLPYLTGQIEHVGKMMLPMHIPVLVCGMLCGWKYGLAVGAVLPLFRSLTLGMPMLYPTAIEMTFELAMYGLMAGLIYNSLKRKNIFTAYRSLIGAMVSGRVVLGLAQIVVRGLGDTKFTWDMFVAGAFVNAVPGIILQLVLVPAIMTVLNYTGSLQREKRKR